MDLRTLLNGIKFWVNNKGYLTEHQSLAAYREAEDQDAIDATKQPKIIDDAGDYYDTDTVEEALQEIGAELYGLREVLGSGVIE